MLPKKLMLHGVCELQAKVPPSSTQSLPREVTWHPELQQLVFSPLAEQAALRASPALYSKTNVAVSGTVNLGSQNYPPHICSLAPHVRMFPLLPDFAPLPASWGLTSALEVVHVATLQSLSCYFKPLPFLSFVVLLTCITFMLPSLSLPLPPSPSLALSLRLARALSLCAALSPIPLKGLPSGTGLQCEVYASFAIPKAATSFGIGLFGTHEAFVDFTPPTGVKGASGSWKVAVGVRSKNAAATDVVGRPPAPSSTLSLLPSDTQIDIRVYYDQTFAEIFWMNGE